MEQVNIGVKNLRAFLQELEVSGAMCLTVEGYGRCGRDMGEEPLDPENP